MKHWSELSTKCRACAIISSVIPISSGAQNTFNTHTSQVLDDYTQHLWLQLPWHKHPVPGTAARLHPHVGQADHLGLESASLLDTDNHGQRGRLRGDALSRPQKRPLEDQGLWGLLAGAHTLIG